MARQPIHPRAGATRRASQSVMSVVFDNSGWLLPGALAAVSRCAGHSAGPGRQEASRAARNRRVIRMHPERDVEGGLKRIQDAVEGTVRAHKAVYSFSR